MQTPKGTKELEVKLNRHFLACSAFIGTAALMTSQNAEASIVYSGIQNAPVASTNGFGGVYIDVDGMSWLNPSAGSGVGAGLLPGWDIQPYRGSGTFGNALRIYTAISPSSAEMVMDSDAVVAMLDSGATIDSSLTFDTEEEIAADWTTGGIGYMGFRFSPSGTPLYGWMRVQTGSGDPGNGGGPGFPATVIDWAYEDSGAGITVGVVPEPSTIALGLLSAGAVGVAAFRKRKKS